MGTGSWWGGSGSSDTGAKYPNSSHDNLSVQRVSLGTVWCPWCAYTGELPSRPNCVWFHLEMLLGLKLSRLTLSEVVHPQFQMMHCPSMVLLLVQRTIRGLLIGITFLVGNAKGGASCFRGCIVNLWCVTFWFNLWGMLYRFNAS